MFQQYLVQPDGSLHHGGPPWYVSWHPRETWVVLDGTFTPQELRMIAAYMEHQSQSSGTEED